MSSTHYDVIIIGAGAAGLMTAITAGERGKKVLVLEAADKVGKKILISGGGRCNFTNLGASPANYISNNPHFCKSALSRYVPQDFIALVEKHGIKYHEKKLGQLFCDNRATDIVNMLLKECEDNRVEIKTDCEVTNISKTENGFELKTFHGPFTCHSLVIATGGLSIPKMGASAFGYQIAKQFGINVLPTEAALVPFLLDPKDLEPLSDIPGISADAVVKTGKTTFRENILVTHKGLSGPAILQISNYWKEGQPVEINLFPGGNLETQIEGWRKNFPSEMLLSLLNPYFTKSFVRNRIEKTVGNKRISEYSKVEIQKLIDVFQHWKLIPSGTEGYTTAEVTRGGVDTNEISSQTFESKKVKGLFFVGEVLDVTGWLGGYNFQWAWSSGFCAGQAV